jgi:hypothetical protein
VSDWYTRFKEDEDSKDLGTTNELKQTRYLEARLKGLPMGTSAQIAGYTGREARSPGKMIESAELRARFQQIAEEKGLTLHRVAHKIEEHLEARANQTLEGKEVTQSEAPDYKIQQKALDQLTNLLGMQDASKVAGGASTVTLSISGPAADRLAAMLGGE